MPWGQCRGQQGWERAGPEDAVMVLGAAAKEARGEAGFLWRQRAGAEGQAEAGHGQPAEWGRRQAWAGGAEVAVERRHNVPMQPSEPAQQLATNPVVQLLPWATSARQRQGTLPPQVRRTSWTPRQKPGLPLESWEPLPGKPGAGRMRLASQCRCTRAVARTVSSRR
jgi:hypothetical protein